MKTVLMLGMLVSAAVMAGDVEIGSSQFPYTAPFCAT